MLNYFSSYIITKNSATRYFYYFILFFNLLLITSCGGGGGEDGSGSVSGVVLTTGGTSSNPQTYTYSDNFTINGLMGAPGGTSYYKIQGLIPDEDYLFTMSTSSEIAFIGFQNTNYSSGAHCWTLAPNGTDTCTANADGVLYVMVYATAELVADSTYTISVVSKISEGSPTAPKNLAGLTPYSATFPATNYKSFFVIDGLTVGNSYTINLDSGSDPSIDLYLYNDAFNTEICRKTSYLSSAKSCMFTASATSIWFTLKGTGSYTVSSTDNGSVPAFSIEGTNTIPTMLAYTADGLLHSGEVDNTNSYYVITGLTASTEYRVRINNIVDDNVDLYVYGDSDLTSLSCESINSRKSTDSCVATSDALGSVWLRVSGENARQFLGATFDISAYAYYPDEGEGGNPAILNYSDGFSYNGTADVFSYYLMQGLAPNTSYLLDVSGYSSTTPIRLTAYGVYGAVFDRCDGREKVSGVLHCIVSSTDLGEVKLTVGEGTYPNSHKFNIAMSLSPYQSEGSVAAPVVLNMTPTGVNETVEFGSLESYYQIDGITAGAAYNVTINLADRFQQFYVYTANSMGSISASVCTGNTYDNTCTVKALDTHLWVRAQGVSEIDGAALPLQVIESTYQAEGSITSPVALAYGTAVLPYSTGVDMSESYFEVTGLTAGTEYAFILDNIIIADSAATAYLYDDASMLGSKVSGEYVCEKSVGSNGGKFCRITPTGTTLWLMVDGYDPSAGALFDIDVVIAPVSESVTIDASSLAVFPRASSTSEISSQYTLSNLDPSKLYMVTLDKHQADLDLTVSNYYGFSDSSCDSQLGTTKEQCIIVPSATGEIFVKVTADKTLFGSFFELGLLAGLSDEGTSASPLDVVHTPGVVTTRNSSVGYYGSYYKITGLEADRMYEVSMIAPSKDIRMSVVRDSTYNSTRCLSDVTGVAGEFCAMNSDASGVLYIKIDGETEGAEFTLEIKDGLLSEGSSAAPVTVNHIGTLTTSNGQVDKGISYYKITGLNAKSDYKISVLAPSDDVSLAVFTDANYNFQECASFTTGVVDESCLATTLKGGGPGKAKLYVWVSGTLTRAGATYTLQIE